MISGKPLYTRLIPALALVGILSGCGTSPNYRFPDPAAGFTDDNQYLARPVGPGLIADPDSPIPDVPMPVGFRGVAEQSTSSLTPRGRSVRHVYQGLADINDANAFYRNRLWRDGWTFESFTEAPDGSAVQAYTKGPERLTINTSQGHKRVTIIVLIQPRG